MVEKYLREHHIVWERYPGGGGPRNGYRISERGILHGGGGSGNYIRLSGGDVIRSHTGIWWSLL